MPDQDNKLVYPYGIPTEPLLIKSMGYEELPFGNKYVVYIKQTIDVYDHFMPSDALIDKMKKENVDVGDKITIEKIAPSEKYQYGYFTVVVVQKGAIADKIEPVKPSDIPTHKSVEKFEKQFESKGDKIGLHELTLRVEKLEKMVTVLSSEAGHKPGDENIPF